MTKQLAHKLVDEFAARSTPGRFNNLHRPTIASGLHARIDNPFLVDQGRAGVCAPASLVFQLAQASPAEYARAVIDLYERGQAQVSKWSLVPDKDLRYAVRPASIAEVDWIILASIRDSENWFFDFNSIDDRGGTPLGEYAQWLRKAGFQDVRRNQILTNLFNKESVLRESLDLYQKNYQMTWMICADMLESGIPSSPRPDHVVVLAGDFDPPSDKSAPVSIPVFTWGEKTTIPRSGGLKYGQFLDQFFGYVAAKH